MASTSTAGASENPYLLKRVQKLEARISKMTALHQWELDQKDTFSQEHYDDYEKLHDENNNAHQSEMDSAKEKHEEEISSARKEADYLAKIVNDALVHNVLEITDTNCEDVFAGYDTGNWLIDQDIQELSIDAIPIIWKWHHKDEQRYRTMKAKMMGHASADKKKHKVICDLKIKIVELRDTRDVALAEHIKDVKDLTSKICCKSDEIQGLKKLVVETSCGAITFEADPETGQF